MKKAVRAIVVRDDQLLAMKRNKFGSEYYVLIGGGVEMGETLEQALRREVAEETCMRIENPRLVFTEEAGPPYGTQYVFLCDYAGGEPVLDPNCIEAELNKIGQNTYQPMWLSIDKLELVTFRSRSLQRALIDGLKNGFPESSKALQFTP